MSSGNDAKKILYSYNASYPTALENQACNFYLAFNTAKFTQDLTSPDVKENDVVLGMYPNKLSQKYYAANGVRFAKSDGDRFAYNFSFIEDTGKVYCALQTKNKPFNTYKEHAQNFFAEEN